MGRRIYVQPAGEVDGRATVLVVVVQVDAEAGVGDRARECDRAAAGLAGLRRLNRAAGRGRGNRGRDRDVVLRGVDADAVAGRAGDRAAVDVDGPAADGVDQDAVGGAGGRGAVEGDA